MRGGLHGGGGAFTLGGRKARAAGRTHRPLAELARDTIDWYLGAFSSWPEAQRPGLSAALERALLEK